MIYYFTDLDDTLFRSYRKQPCAQQLASNLQVVAVDKTGQPVSYMTSKQHAFFVHLMQTGRIIPVTARNVDAYTRVTFPEKFKPAIAVLNHGGTVMINNSQIDLMWEQHIRQQLSPAKSMLECLQSVLATDYPKLNVRLISENGICLYVVIKCSRESYQPGILASVASALPEAFRKNSISADCLTVHHNDNNLAIFPKDLNKSHAVAYVIDKHLKLQLSATELPITVGIGDSNSDLEFMTRCDYSLTPNWSQIISSTQLV